MIRLTTIGIIFLQSFLGMPQTPEKILQEHFKKVGQSTWEQIQTVTIEGRWVDENYYGHNMKLTAKKPDKIRIEGKYAGKPFIESFNGTDAWSIAPWNKKYTALPMAAFEKVVLLNSFHLGSPLYPIQKQLTFEGLVDMEGILYHTFVYESGGIKKTFYLDREDHLLYYEKIEIPSENKSIVKLYEKYKTYQGMRVPAAVRFESEGLEKELVFDRVYVGLGARNSFFDMPKSQ